MAESIASHVTHCLSLLQSLVEAGKLEPVTLQKMKDEQTRFKMWSGNIGAHKTGMSSLDYRLRDASHLRAQVINLLCDLSGLINDAAAIASGDKTSWDQLDADELSAGSGLDEDGESEDDSPATELEQIALDVADVVDCLLRLSVAIRNPAPHDRFVEAKETDTSHFEHFDIQHVHSRFNTTTPWLARRLGKAISRRRQYFRYRESHHDKLSHGLEPHDAGKAEGETVASSIPDHLKEKASSNPTPALPAIVEDDRSDAGVSQTSYATSFTNPGKLTIPPLPEEAHKGPFECRFCYMMIVATDRAAWKKHVYGDLQPYVCLAEDCTTPEREFSRRHQWMEHVRQNHWNVYQCPFGCDAPAATPFPSAADCKDHLAKAHGVSQTEQAQALVKLTAKPLDIAAGVTCPLCPEVLRSAKQYQRHVGRHQEQLSLFALPSWGSDEDEDADSDSGASRNDEAGSVNLYAIGSENAGSMGLPEDAESTGIPESAQPEADGGSVSSSDFWRARLVHPHLSQADSEDMQLRASEGIVELEHKRRQDEDSSLEERTETVEQDADIVPPVKFKDAVGRTFAFPFKLCRTWEDMDRLIKQSFLRVDVLGPHVQEGHYDLYGPNNEIIPPSTWESVVQPGFSVTMHMWPMDNAPLPGEGPDRRFPSPPRRVDASDFMHDLVPSLPGDSSDLDDFGPGATSPTSSYDPDRLDTVYKSLEEGGYAGPIRMPRTPSPDLEYLDPLKALESDQTEASNPAEGVQTDKKSSSGSPKDSSPPGVAEGGLASASVAGLSHRYPGNKDATTSEDFRREYSRKLAILCQELSLARDSLEEAIDKDMGDTEVRMLAAEVERLTSAHREMEITAMQGGEPDGGAEEMHTEEERV